jgi:cytochrome oxidase Cu insertion factor (SCO1/SenC/PrrC family)
MQFGDAFDLSYEADGGLINHNLRTVLIDKEGKLAKVYKGNDWSVAEVSAAMRSLMQQ